MFQCSIEQDDYQFIERLFLGQEQDSLLSLLTSLMKDMGQQENSNQVYLVTQVVRQVLLHLQVYLDRGVAVVTPILRHLQQCNLLDLFLKDLNPTHF